MRLKCGRIFNDQFITHHHHHHIRLLEVVIGNQWPVTHSHRWDCRWNH